MFAPTAIGLPTNRCDNLAAAAYFGMRKRMIWLVKDYKELTIWRW